MKVTRRVARQEFDMTIRSLVTFRCIACALCNICRHDEITVCVLNVDDTLRTDDANLDAVDCTRPYLGQSPGNVH